MRSFVLSVLLVISASCYSCEYCVKRIIILIDQLNIERDDADKNQDSELYMYYRGKQEGMYDAIEQIKKIHNINCQY